MTYSAPVSSVLLVVLTLLSSCCHGYVSLAKRTRRVFIPAVLKYIDHDYDVDQRMTPWPSLQQVSTDSFTDQAFHASTLISELSLTPHNEAARLQELLTAQLSHRDGIRGFFAVYLTRPELADAQTLPGPLTLALKGVDMGKLAPLACMNVIRPVAMACWHTDPILKENSLKTAQRAKKFVEGLQGSINVVKNNQAIYAVASTLQGKGIRENQLELFWQVVFEDAGYNEEQRKAISATFASFLSPQIKLEYLCCFAWGGERGQANPKIIVQR